MRRASTGYSRDASTSKDSEVSMKVDEPVQGPSMKSLIQYFENAASVSVESTPCMLLTFVKTASAFVTLDLARRVVNVLSTYPGATLTKMTLVPNSSLGIQNTSSLLTGSLHLRERTVRDPDRPHVVDSRPRIDHTWLITVWTRHMEKSLSEYDSFTPCQLEA